MFHYVTETSDLTTSDSDGDGDGQSSSITDRDKRAVLFNWPRLLAVVGGVVATLAVVSVLIWSRLAVRSGSDRSPTTPTSLHGSSRSSVHSSDAFHGNASHLYRKFDSLLAKPALTTEPPLLAEPNPPHWPSSVTVFGPDEDPQAISRRVFKVFAQNGGQQPPNNGQFSKARFALLFKPGTYNVEVPVGYYTQVLGLGGLPQDVTFISAKGVYSQDGDPYYKVGALNNFWRSAENFRTNAFYQWIDFTPQPNLMPNKPPAHHGMLWAVSQAAPLRRVLVERDLILFEVSSDGFNNGRASGGFMSNVEVRGGVMFGTQQQWLMRNGDIGGCSNGNWNMVFVGVNGAPVGQCGNRTNPYITVGEAPVIAEKPFISIDSVGKYQLNIPQLKAHRRGVMFNDMDDVIVSFDRVYVATDTDTSAKINTKLSVGLHVILSPGIYHMDQPLQLNKESQVLLGLGFATLVATAGNALIRVGNVGGVRIAGVLLEAGPTLSENLLVWGSVGYPGSAANPGFLHDVFVRVGGPSKNAQADVMLRINAGHVVGDNVWLWRADHGDGYVTTNGENPCKMGAVISGDDVTMYGLFAEHNLQDQVQWSGQRGRVYLLQTELPYDAGPGFGSAGYAGFRVNASVGSHIAYGVGVYHFFRDHAVTVASGVVAPAVLERFFFSPVGIALSGMGTMQHVLNDKGKETSKLRKFRAYVCPPLAGTAPVTPR